MKKLLLGALGLVAMAAPAVAADLAVKAAPPPVYVAPIYNWGGFYIGGNGGYAWSNQCINITGINGFGNAFNEGCRSAGGGVVGGQVGYRWQASSWVFGLEAQGDWTNIRTSRASLFPSLVGDTWTSKIDGLGLFTGQVGYAWNATLLYVKGGAAVVDQNYYLNNTLSGLGLAQVSQSRWGGTVGVGLEYGFAPNWSAAIEYDYLWKVGNNNTFLTPGLAPAVTNFTANTASDVNMITARINYHFNWGKSPVVARY